MNFQVYSLIALLSLVGWLNGAHASEKEEYLKLVSKLVDPCLKEGASVPELDKYFEALLLWFPASTKTHQDIQEQYRYFKEDCSDMNPRDASGAYRRYLCSMHEGIMEYLEKSESSGKRPEKDDGASTSRRPWRGFGLDMEHH